MSKVSSALWTYSQKVEIPAGKYPAYTKGEHVRFISILRGKLAWKEGVVLGRKVPGLQYIIKMDDGTTTTRHPADLRRARK